MSKSLFYQITNKFKKYFSKFFKYKHFKRSRSETSALLRKFFSKTSKEIAAPFLYHIYKNNFVVNSDALIELLMNEYDLSVIEASALMFKFGVLTKIYTEDPIALLQDILELCDLTVIETEKIKKSLSIYYNSVEQEDNKVQDKLDIKEELLKMSESLRKKKEISSEYLDELLKKYKDNDEK